MTLVASLSELDDDLGPDARLAREAAGGDSRAASELFDRFSALVRRILARTLGPHHDLEDHVQEAFFVFFRRLNDLEDASSVRAFLVSIAVRTARAELRRRKVRRVLRLAPPPELVELAGGADPLDADGRDALRRFFRILDDLDTPSRLLFTLRHLEEMPLEEIASVTGESLSTVKRRLARVIPLIDARLAADPSLSRYRSTTRTGAPEATR